MSPFATIVRNELAAANIPAELVSDFSDAERLRRATVVFSTGSTVLKFSQEDDNYFLEIASTWPGEFHWVGDVELATGLKSLDELFSRPANLPIKEIVRALGANLHALGASLTNDLEKIRRASAVRLAHQFPLLAKPGSH